MRNLSILLLCLSLVGCSTPTIGGVKKPTLFTMPPKYLDTFPLGTVVGEDLIRSLGVPDKTTELNGKIYYSYQFEGTAQREYVYEISNGVVVDVVYHDTGSYNGLSARERQSK